jgi:hypothetical protein
VRRTTTMRATAFAVCTVLIGAGQAGVARAAARDHANTFSGSCQLSGTSRFTPPLTSTPVQGADHTTVSGPCSGSFTDRHGRTHDLGGATVRFSGIVQGVSSCETGLVTGSGVLTFPWGRLALSVREPRGPGFSALEFTGRRGGSASGTAMVSPSENPLQLSEECAGAGIKSVASQLTFATTPTISG